MSILRAVTAVCIGLPRLPVTDVKHRQKHKHNARKPSQPSNRLVPNSHSRHRSLAIAIAIATAMAALARRATPLLRSVRAVSAESSTFRRSFSAGAGKPSAEAGDDVVKAVFQRQQKNFRAYLEEISKTKLDLDSNSEAAVKAYFETQAKIRANLGLSSYTQKIADLLEGAAEEAPDVRTYLSIHSSLRREVGIEDDSGADALMMEALEKVEKNIGKPLVKDDANGMSGWKKELDQINEKLGISDSMLEKLEEEAEYAAAKAELEELRNVAMDRIETYKRRDELTIEVSPKELDHRTYL